jgi:hypothetical protein
MLPVLQLFNGCGWFGKWSEKINKEKLVYIQNLFINSPTKLKTNRNIDKNDQSQYCINVLLHFIIYHIYLCK